jgi:hypothetical protein
MNFLKGQLVTCKTKGAIYEVLEVKKRTMIIGLRVALAPSHRRKSVRKVLISQCQLAVLNDLRETARTLEALCARMLNGQ